MRAQLTCIWRFGEIHKVHQIRSTRDKSARRNRPRYRACLDFYLRRIPEIFRYGHEVGEIVHRIALSIISSYVFFLIVVHIKAEKDKENINTYVAEKVRRIVGRCGAQINELARAGGVSEEKLWDDETEVIDAFRRSDPHDNAPLLLGWPANNANWLQFLDYHRLDTLSTVEKLFRKMPFLDSQLVVLLARVEDCIHFSANAIAANNPFRNTDMEVWASGFYEYVVLCKELQSYLNKELKDYN